MLNRPSYRGRIRQTHGWIIFIGNLKCEQGFVFLVLLDLTRRRRGVARGSRSAAGRCTARDFGGRGRGSLRQEALELRWRQGFVVFRLVVASQLLPEKQKIFCFIYMSKLNDTACTLSLLICKKWAFTDLLKF